MCQAGTLSRDLESALKRPLILGVRAVGANRSLQVAVSGVGPWVPAAWGGGGLAGVGVMMVMVGDPPCWEMGGRVSLQGSRDQGDDKEGAWSFTQSFLRQVVALFFGFRQESYLSLQPQESLWVAAGCGHRAGCLSAFLDGEGVLGFRQVSKEVQPLEGGEINSFR